VKLACGVELGHFSLQGGNREYKRRPSRCTVEIKGFVVFPEEKCCRYSSACSAGNPENRNPSSWLLN
jgi:hypothetical protein